MYGKYYDDIEFGRFANMADTTELRWALIRKIYVILAVQLAMTATVAYYFVANHSAAQFFKSSSTGIALYVMFLILPFIVMCPLYAFRQEHPINFILLGVFTIAISFAVGMSCAYTNGTVVLEAAILTVAVVVVLTLYTFWASSVGCDFEFCGPFLATLLTVLVVFGVIQVFFPFGKLSVMIYSAVAAMVFCGYIVYDTDNIINRYPYDEYIWAAVALYLDVINLFLQLLQLLKELNDTSSSR